MAVKTRMKVVVTQIADNESGKIVGFEWDSTSNTIEEDEVFSKLTPQVRLEVVINNPILSNQFAIGEKYYLDLTSAE